MKYTVEKPLSSFDFWGTAGQHAEKLTIEELDRIEDVLTMSFEDLTELRINDLFAFDFDWICELIGLDSSEVIERE